MFCLWFSQQLNTESNRASEQIFSQVLLFLSLSSFMGKKTTFHADPRFAKFWNFDFFFRFLAISFETSLLRRSFEGKQTFQTITCSRIHHDQDVSSSYNTSFTREAENSFSSSTWGPEADGSFLEVTQGQRESRLELIISPTLPCPPLRQEQLSLPWCCSTMGKGKENWGAAGGRGEKGRWLAVPSAWLAWGGWLKIWMWPMQLGWLNSLKSVDLGLLKFFFFTPAELFSSEGHVLSCTTAVFRGAYRRGF